MPYRLYSQVWERSVRLFGQNAMHVAFWQTAVTGCGFRATRNIAKYMPRPQSVNSALIYGT
ncbi:hypothetical protein GCM10011328_20490 [Hafnia psychrotolerans]|uniref:Uncharacterized protein n=1 Tax=Hafnia psychrotolerans TaxID=1477018 RepID=A0ABQ1GK73_9GAMM|nr:hypothetical protein GCM10011328_20490 [Hafnia psychrotolerans]